jgi:hypothetical protein
MKKIAVVLTVLASIVLAGAAEALEFSADMVSTAAGRSATGKMFVANDKVRMEMAGAISITRIDKKLVWLVMPDQGMYMEQPFDPMKIAGATEKMPGEIERTFLGEESVNGRNARKYRVTYSTAGRRDTVLQWVDIQSGIPVKTSAEDGSWSVEYKNLRVGPQDTALFEMPQGYTKFEVPNMADMMKAMGAKTGRGR